MPKSAPATPPFVLLADAGHQDRLEPLSFPMPPSRFIIVPLLPPGATSHDAPAMVRIEAKKGEDGAASALDIRVEEAGAKKRVHLFQRTAPEGAWQSRGATGQWGGGAAEIGLAALPASGADPASLANDFTLSIGIAGSPDALRRRIRCRIAPVLLTSPLDPVETVLVVRSSLTKPFVDELARLVPRCEGAPKLLPLDFEAVPHDVWMQDTAEIGRSAVPGPGGVDRQTVAPLLGLRARHDGIPAALLDSFVASQLAKTVPGAVCITPALPREHTRWIDWYGNLEVSPPVKRFPYGRILTGQQKELGMHPDLMAFLEAQKLQWPPLILDVSWLTIGHVDELITFVSTAGRPGFRAILPSPAKARALLETAVKNGHGDVPVFAGKGKSETTVKRLRDDIANAPETEAIERALAETREKIKDGLGISDREIVTLPALYQNGLAVIPSGVNSLVVGTHVFIPDPCGPVIDGEDVFRRATRQSLAPLGLTLHFVDIWEPYHVRSGEIHCGTNAIRRLANPLWWKTKRGRK